MAREQVPGARARLFEDEGHLSLTLRFDEIVDELRRHRLTQTVMRRPAASNASGTRAAGSRSSLVAKEGEDDHVGGVPPGPDGRRRRSVPSSVKPRERGTRRLRRLAGSIRISTRSTPQTRNATVVNAAVASRASPAPTRDERSSTDLERLGPDPGVEPGSADHLRLLAVEQAVDEVLPEIEHPAKPAKKLDLLVERRRLVVRPRHPWPEMLEAGAERVREQRCIARFPAADRQPLGVHAIRRRDAGLGGAQRSYATRRARRGPLDAVTFASLAPRDRRTDPCPVDRIGAWLTPPASGSSTASRAVQGPTRDLVARLLEEHENDVAAVDVVMGDKGIFDVHVDDVLVFTKSMIGGYPEPDHVLPLVRAQLAS